MDNVPVKISEKYKRPPRIYQVPQSVANRLQTADDHYTTAPQYAYDFQLERKVLTKIPEWRRMRQLEKDARRERHERREMLRLRAAEAQQKQLLGAVSYPSAEEFSSSDDDEDTVPSEPPAATAATKLGEAPVTEVPANMFHNILQPTILPQKINRCDGDSTLRPTSCDELATSKWTYKGSSAFNYEDFENDTSSPFDNIELKTINDLDILAQCLHNTQLTAAHEKAAHDEAERRQEEEEQKEAKDPQDGSSEETSEETVNANTQSGPEVTDPPAADSMESTMVALKKVDFHALSDDLPENANIPQPAASGGYYYDLNGHPHHYAPTQPQPIPPSNTSYTHYTQPYRAMPHLPQQTHSPIQHQLNALYTPSSNGVSTNAYYVTTQYEQYPATKPGYVGGASTTVVATPVKSHLQNFTDYANAAKAKSVPDILRELSDEVHNSEMRRSRNVSYNLNDDVNSQTQATPSEHASQQPQQPDAAAPTVAVAQYYSKLEPPTQKLAKIISSMGFPLERVARIAQIYGADDKKIIEHLIPLSEIMDLGFEEAKISEALLKHDNNKDKALDYLIS